MKDFFTLRRHRKPKKITWKQHLIRGGEAGFIAAIAFTAMFSLTGTANYIGVSYGASPAVLIILHFILAVIGGLIFSLSFSRFIGSHARCIGLGVLFGFGLWIINSTLLVGLVSESSESLPIILAPALWGHLIYGAVLGLVYDLLVPDSEQE